MEKVNIADAFQSVEGFWNPLIIGELNDQAIKIAKFKGAFDWHHHEHEDEAFLVIQGAICIEFRDKTIKLSQGELCVVPRGVEHRPVADEEAQVLLFEPSTTVNTGNVTTEKTRILLKRL
jgi:mannose-6-phosphate isomerase-like protein (cupin superfamily)